MNQLLQRLQLTPGQRIKFAPVSANEFDQLAAYSEWLMEWTIIGEMYVMAPTGGETGIQNADLTAQVVQWNKQTKLGVVFDSSTVFRLPNGARRGPDVAWVALARWNQLTPEQRAGFPPLCPDFVIELRSRTDDLNELRAKMKEYIDNGCQLGWLINPQDQQVEVYQPSQVVTLSAPNQLLGEDILPGLIVHPPS
ncbi:MAG: Uma2 family endonuclease [Cyanothece sp. SIO1E1]|nr:Uma2 family endonuclease [Cyanothece sp. SIO1E1]